MRNLRLLILVLLLQATSVTGRAQDNRPFISAPGDILVVTDPQRGQALSCEHKRRDAYGCSGLLLACPDGLAFIRQAEEGKISKKTSKGDRISCPRLDPSSGTFIRYSEITALARGANTPENLSNLSTALTAAAAGVVAASTVNKWLGFAVASGIAVFASHRWLSKSRKEHYLSIFFDSDQDRAGFKRKKTREAAEKGNVHFPEGDVAIFRVDGRYQYWDICMILDAKTGLEFESEGAEVGGP